MVLSATTLSQLWSKLASGHANLVPLAYGSRQAHLVPLAYATGSGQANLVPLAYATGSGQANLVPPAYATGSGQVHLVPLAYATGSGQAHLVPLAYASGSGQAQLVPLTYATNSGQTSSKRRSSYERRMLGWLESSGNVGSKHCLLATTLVDNRELKASSVAAVARAKRQSAW